MKISSFIDYLDKKGFGPFIGVPCSLLKTTINYLESHESYDYKIVNNEGEALSLAAGAYMAGKKPVVLLQNSGLGNMVNPLTSLTYVYKIPILLIISWRGEPDSKDQPQHFLMGKITATMLDELEVKHMAFPDTDEAIIDKVDRATEYLDNTLLPFAFLLGKKVMLAYESEIFSRKHKSKAEVFCGVKEDYKDVMKLSTGFLTRKSAIVGIHKQLSNQHAYIASTGHISRELFCCCDGPANFYMMGSMGCASSIGLGISLYHPNNNIVILEGDGAILMRLESLVSIGYYRPRNLIHIILDNHMYETTGGQKSLSTSVKLDNVAMDCGYASAVSIDNEEQLISALGYCERNDGPHLIHINIHTEVENESDSGRVQLTPEFIKERFITFLESR